MKKSIFYVLAVLFLAVSSLSVFAKTKVACIGNSITFGYGLSSPSTQSYPTKLQALLGNEYEVSNYGVSARTMLKKGDRPYWNESAYTQAKASNPDIVIIMLGTNDAKLATNWTPHKTEFDDDYKAMIKAFRNLSSAPEIWVCKIVPAYKEIWEISNTTIVNEVNPVITQVSVDAGTHLIDMYTAMDNRSNLFQSDGIHPTKEGATAMANFIYGALMSDTLAISENEGILSAPEGFGYQWYLNSKAIGEADGGNAKELTPKETGIYKVAVKIKASEATMVMSDTISYDVTTSVEKDANAPELSVKAFPNPCAEMLYFETSALDGTSYSIDLFSIDGNLVLSNKVASKGTNVQVDISHLSAGVYFYSVKCDNGHIVNGKIKVI